jgi:DNA repair protein RadA/Sms
MSRDNKDGTVVTTRPDNPERPNIVSAKPRERIKLTRASDIEPVDIKWLWYPYIPQGKLVMLEGDPGLGKSWISCALAADISAGRPLPGQKEAFPPQKVLMLSAEDGLEETIQPRLARMQANMQNIYISDSTFVFDAQGIREMEDKMREMAITIVFIDPIVAYMGAGLDMNKANEVRSMMGPMIEAAKRTGTSMVAIRHLRKGGGANAKYRGIGSIDFTAAVRSSLQVGETKSGQTYLAHVKHNLSPKGETLAYSVEDGRFQWGGVLPLSEGTAEKSSPSVSTKKMSEVVQEFLFDLLRDGAVPSQDVHAHAARLGFGERSLNSAKKAMGVKSYKRGDNWYWELGDGVGEVGAHGFSPKQSGSGGGVAGVPVREGLSETVRPVADGAQSLPADVLAAARAKLNAKKGPAQ